MQAEFFVHSCGHPLSEHVDQPVEGTMQAEFLSIAAAIFYQST